MIEKNKVLVGTLCQRESGLELLRIIAICMVVFMHSAGQVQGQLSFFNIFVGTLQNSICNIGVTCFVLIAGCFGIKRKAKKIITMEVMILFYSLLSLIIQILVENYSLQSALFHHPSMFLKAFFPIVTYRYWFLSCYIFLTLLSPYINDFIESLSKQKFEYLLILLIILFYFFPTFFYFEITNDHGKGLINMIICYFIGRYIGLYCGRVVSRTRMLVAFIVIIFLEFFGNITLHILYGKAVSIFARDNSIFILFAAIAFFMLFRSFRFKSSVINNIAKHVLAVYCFETTLRLYIVHHYFDLSPLSSSNILFLAVFLYTLFIFLSCLVIEFFRGLLFARAESWAICKIEILFVSSCDYLKKRFDEIKRTVQRYYRFD